MLKYVRKITANCNYDNRSTEQKISDLRNIGINVSTRNCNDEYREGYILGKVKSKRVCAVF